MRQSALQVGYTIPVKLSAQVHHRKKRNDPRGPESFLINKVDDLLIGPDRKPGWNNGYQNMIRRIKYILRKHGNTRRAIQKYEIKGIPNFSQRIIKPMPGLAFAGKVKIYIA